MHYIANVFYSYNGLLTLPTQKIVLNHKLKMNIKEDNSGAESKNKKAKY